MTPTSNMAELLYKLQKQQEEDWRQRCEREEKKRATAIEKLAREHEIEDVTALERAISTCNFLRHGNWYGIRVDKGPDTLDEVAKLLTEASFMIYRSRGGGESNYIRLLLKAGETGEDRSTGMSASPTSRASGAYG